MKRDLLSDIENNKYSSRDCIADLVPYLLEGIPMVKSYFLTLWVD